MTNGRRVAGSRNVGPPLGTAARPSDMTAATIPSWHTYKTSWPWSRMARAKGTVGKKCPRPPEKVNRARTGP